MKAAMTNPSPSVPLLRLSDVKRRQRRAGALMLVILIGWVASLIGVIALARPMMVARPVWYVLLIVLYMALSFAGVVWGWFCVHRWFGLRCPHCGTTFVYVDVKGRARDLPLLAGEDERRCDSCRAIMLDLDS